MAFFVSCIYLNDKIFNSFFLFLTWNFEILFVIFFCVNVMIYSSAMKSYII